jgi:tRNA modification GTPase
MTTKGNRPTSMVLTPAGRGAVATIEWRGDVRLLEGPSAVFQAANGIALSQQPAGRTVFGAWGRGVSEDVVLCRVDESRLEIHCHGGAAAVQRILDDLRGLGSDVVPTSSHNVWSTHRLDADCFDVLTRTTTLRTADIVMQQAHGTLRREIEAIQHAIDDRDQAAALVGRLEAILQWTRFGLHLTEPWRVVLAGRPNVGKSSLMNALVGYARSIVYDQPGTTRDLLTADTAFDGWPFRFLDTAGLRETTDPIESAGIARTREASTDADLVVLLVDASTPPTTEDFDLLASMPAALVVAHKCDLPDAWGSEVPKEALAVSSRNGLGVDGLLAAVVQRLVPVVPRHLTPIPVTLRQVAILKEARDAASAREWDLCRVTLDRL